MRQLAIGDIHGCFKALTTLEAFVPFGADDVIVTLGDYVDRGPNSFAVLDWLIRRFEQGKLIPLRGNHEIMMLDARQSPGDLKRWCSYGGDAALASYAILGEAGGLVDVPDAHWHFLEHALRPFHETDTHIFVHANLYPDHPLDEQPDYMLYWESLANPQPHESGKIMVCGHTPQKTGKPLDAGHTICLDTWACGNGWLTCLDVLSRKYWQAKETGERRSGRLEG